MRVKNANPSPYLHASQWSRFFHSWIYRLFEKLQKRGTLHLVDLYDLLPHYQSTDLSEQLEENWLHETKHYQENSSLFRATLRTVRWKPFLIGCILIPLKLLTVTQPLLIIYLMDFFEPCSSMSIAYASFLALCTLLSALFSSVCFQTFSYLIQAFALQMRIAYQGLIYRKILRLSSQSLNRFSSGEITNVFSNDASQIETTIIAFNHIWITIVDICIMIVFFWYFIKYIVLIAIGYTIVLVSVEYGLGHVLVHLRRRILLVTDERVKIMSEIIKSMRIVKMYCWEAAFEKKICRIRKREILRCAIRLVFDSLQMLFSQTYICVTLLLMFTTIWTLDIRFNTKFFAVACCMLGYIEVSILEFGIGIHSFAQYLTAEKRIQSFLLLGESERDQRLLSAPVNEQKEGNNSSRIECHIKQAKWEEKGLFSLQNIVFDARPGDLICVIGPVGSGKSSLLQTLTGEIALFDGQIRMHGSFCYVPQESWIFSSTLIENILFGKEYQSHLFQRVIRAAALETDLVQLSVGLNTPVGDHGVMLSGGQKARVNLARALYRDADIYLLDDPLSAVDAKVSKYLFENSIKGYLRNKICILVTHQIQFLKDATTIIVLEHGTMTQMGTYMELLASSSSFRRLLDNIHQQEQEHSSETQNERSARSRANSEKNDVDTDDDNGDVSLLAESLERKLEGSVSWQVYISYIRAGAGLVLGTFLLTFVFGMREAASIYYIWWLAKWSDDETHRYQQSSNCTEVYHSQILRIQSMSDTEWRNYRNGRFYTFRIIAMIAVLVTLFRISAGKWLCLNAGRVLHNQMFRRLIRSPMTFFDSNPVGRVLNRFTKDIAIIDEHLPWTFFDFIQCLFQVLGVVALVSWLNPWSMVPAVMAAIWMLSIRCRFAPCSRDLKRLENITRSPIYSYLTSTIDGLRVIRSYYAEKICSKEFFAYLDDNTRASYLFLTANRWVALRFDWIALFFISIVTSLALIAHINGRHFSAADIALTLSYSLMLVNLLQWTIRQSVEVETQMTSVERILEYCFLDQEPPAHVSSEHQPPIHWPQHGRIVFDQVSMSHSEEADAPLALTQISLNIEAREKVGIVGRTGAGKSSFIQTLFRMGTIVSGQITIDQIDIATVGLYDVRRHISIIPQDPVLFTGTMRSNLDQFGDYSDAEIWHALEQVQLKKLVTDGMSNGLQSLVSESGANLSVGQKQLVCLARAILRKSKLLVIDEATANVDNATDELIQRAIREKFKECTVLTVAHRLRTVIDSDRILVLGNGKVLEFASPHVLLANPNSHFTSLVQQTGSAEADHLRHLANVIKSNSS